MESIAEGLWQLAEQHEKAGCIAQAVKCLEAICQSLVSFLPVIEVKTRLRIATLLLQHTDNVTHAKAHLERAVRVVLHGACKSGILEVECRFYDISVILGFEGLELQTSFLRG